MFHFATNERMDDEKRECNIISETFFSLSFRYFFFVLLFVVHDIALAHYHLS